MNTVGPKGVTKLLNNLNIHKAPGPDGLSARVLKECSSEIAPILACIYNESLAQGAVPDDWAENKILFVCPLPTYPHFTPLPKKLYCNFV